MARIRTIKPEFFTSEQVSEASPNARLLFLGLIVFSDDKGRHPASVKRLKMEVFPGDPFTANAIAEWVEELIRVGLVAEYECSQGQRYWHVTGFERHQKVDKPTVRFPGPFDEGSTIIRRTLSDHSTTESNGMESNGMESNGVEASLSASADGGALKDDLSPDLLDKEYTLVARWNSCQGVTRNQGDHLTESRRRKFRTRLKVKGWYERAFQAMDKFPLRCFADQPGAWKPDMEWFLLPDSVTKILEGKYDFVKGSTTPPPSPACPIDFSKLKGSRS